MRVLVTRPEPQASDWTHGLVALGVQAFSLPLLAILPAEDPAALERAWLSLGHRDGVMFVSPAAAQAWLDARPEGCAWPARVWVAAPGPGTARCLAVLGADETLVPAADAAQFDSDALWSAIERRAWRGNRILVVHGGGGRDDLSQRWREAGAVVDKLQAYRRGDATWSSAQNLAFEAALNEPEAHVWLFSSGEAIGRLDKRVAQASRVPNVSWAAHRAVCTHPAIAERARRAGFDNVRDCRPDIDAVVAAVRDGSWAAS